MDYIRRNITLSVELNERLKNEPNASAVVAQALKNYYSSRETTKQLIRLVGDFEGTGEQLLKQMKSIKQDLDFIKTRAGA